MRLETHGDHRGARPTPWREDWLSPRAARTRQQLCGRSPSNDRPLFNQDTDCQVPTIPPCSDQSNILAPEIGFRTSLWVKDGERGAGVVSGGHQSGCDPELQSGYGMIRSFPKIRA